MGMSEFENITHSEWHGLTAEERIALCDAEIKRCEDERQDDENDK